MIKNNQKQPLKHKGKYIYPTLLVSRHPLNWKMRKEEKHTACRVRGETSIIFLLSSVTLNTFRSLTYHTAALRRVERKKESYLIYATTFEDT